jgi:hypothetical protein
MWEMLLGGVAYIYPLTIISKNKNKAELLGLLFILGSYVLISQATPWPGYLAIIPVFGAYLIIQARNENSILTGNYIFQKLGTWSYSIYLWHWPIVVFIYYYSLPEYWSLIGIALSVFLGYLSYQHIEKIKLSQLFTYKNFAFKCSPLLLIYFIGATSCYVYYTNGELAQSSAILSPITKNLVPSPYRKECHTGGDNYTEPKNACTYFNGKVTWAILGDSHAVELAYAIAEQLEKTNESIKHFSFSDCIPSFKQNKEFSKCVKWTNDSVLTVLSDNNIDNIVISYRYSAALFGDQLASYPAIPQIYSKDDFKRKEILNALDLLIEVIAKNKKNVFVIKPIPELGNHINVLLRNSYRHGSDIENIKGSTMEYYEQRNEFILNHFKNVVYQDNVHFIDPAKYICDGKDCWAIKKGLPIYFDDDHLTVFGALLIVNEMFND